MVYSLLHEDAKLVLEKGIGVMKKLLLNLSQVHHVNGALYRIEPTPAFAPLPPGQTLDIEFVCGEAQAARFYIMPNWYWRLDDVATGLI